MKFVDDKELEQLTDDNDLLDSSQYVKTLSQTIVSAQTPFNIGLFGEWGSGKSSIINSVKEEIKKSPDKKDIAFVTYDAWKYSNDSFRRTFLKALQEQLELETTESFDSFYIDKASTAKINKKLNWPFVIAALILFLVGLGFLYGLPEDNVELKVGVPLIFTVISVAVAISRSLFDNYDVKVTNPKIFAPEQFEDVFNQVLEKTIKDFSIVDRVINWFKNSGTVKGIKKLVIVIDNIDRCDKETAFELLTTIKTFLDKTGVIFLVPVDDVSLRRHLKNKSNDEQKEADEFLRKLFNLTIKIKPFQTTDLYLFADGINHEYELNFDPNTIYILAKEFASNPRRIIQLMNNLSFELQTISNRYGEKFSKRHESIAAVFLILKEEWPDIYQALSINPHLFLDKDKNGNFDGIEVKDEAKLFLNNTSGFFIGVEHDVIEQLLTNLSKTRFISRDAALKIEQKKYNEVFQTNESTRNIFLYVLELLLTEIKRYTYASGAVNRFKDLINLNIVQSAPEEVFLKVHHSIDYSQFQELLNYLDVNSLDALLKFNSLFKESGFSEIDKILVNNFQYEWRPKKEKLPTFSDKPSNPLWKVGVIPYLKSVDIQQNQDELQKLFNSYYIENTDYFLFKEDTLTDESLKLLIPYEFIRENILPKTRENISEEIHKELSILSNLGIIEIDHLGELFSLFIPQDITRAWQGQNPNIAKEHITTLVNQGVALNSKLIQNISAFSTLPSRVIAFFDYIFNHHHIVVNHGQAINITPMQFLSTENSEKLLELLFTISEKTGGQADIKRYFNALTANFTELETPAISGLIMLHSKEVNLSSFWDWIFEKEINGYQLELLKNVLPDAIPVNRDKVKEKLNSILLNVVSESAIPDIEDFIDTMLSIPELSNLLSELISELPKEQVILLPESLKNMVKAGPQYKDTITRVVVSKLQKEGTVQEALDILESFKRPTKEQRQEILPALRRHEEHESEVVQKSVKEFIKRWDK